MMRTGIVSFLPSGFFRQILPELRMFIIGIVFFLVLAPAAAAGIPDTDSNPVSSDNASLQTAAGQIPFTTLPAIVPNDTPGFFIRQYTFPFQKKNITIPVNVSAAVYYGAKNGNKYASAPAGESPEALAPGYYRAFVNDPAQDVLYANLLNDFRTIRMQNRYTDDEYAELLSVFVQSLPFDNMSSAHPDTLSRFPAETLVDGTGDCDDKSVLLAGLLSREGYNVSLLLFIPEHHMAVGLAGECFPFNDTGYLYVETTGLSFIGDVPERLNPSERYRTDDQEPGSTVPASVPVVIPVGTGSRNFTRGDETRFIVTGKNGIDARIAYLKEQIDADTRKDQPRFRSHIETYNAYAAIHNYITKHRYDRAGTYHYLVSVVQPPCTGQKSYVAQLVSPPAPPTSETPVNPPAGSCRSMPSLSDGFATVGALPCPREIQVSQQCQWQNIWRDLVIHPTG
jgi:hypothetical protein